MAGAAAALCLVVAGSVARILPTDHFELSWQHSIEKTAWRETYAVERDRLLLVEASVEGSGAGMEPPPGAIHVGGGWRYRPALPPLPEIHLAASDFTADYRLCWKDACAALRELVPERDGGVTLRPCTEKPANAKGSSVANE